MKKKWMKGIVSTVLAATLAIGQFGIANWNEVQAAEAETITLQDSDFTGDVWKDGVWTITPDSWTGAEFENYTYSSNTWLETTDSQGETCLKFYFENEGNFTLTQKVTLSAGTYTFTADAMGENADFYFMIGDSKTDTSLSLSGWNTWVDGTGTITITEDMTDVAVGFYGDVAAGGYGYIDSIELTRSAAGSTDSGSTDSGNTDVPEETVDPVENNDINLTRVSNLSDDFIMGMDISSVISEFDSGVTYKDYEGNTISNVTDFCKFLSANGITHIRVRVWNNPYDSNGNGYGGGNSDVAKAKQIADACRVAGLKMLVDFHCSDFWADPGKQQAPKAWSGYTLEQKKTAVAEFISESLNTIDSQKNVVAMVQVGNETTGSFVGETGTENMCALFSSGVDAVHAYNTDVKAVIHVTNPEKGNVTTWAKRLSDNNVDYDVLATSYYPYWHGTLANLKSEFETVKSTYGKDVMVAETSYAYTLDDSDGHDNTVRVGNNDTGSNTTEPFTVQGQATAIRNLINTVNEAGGLGVFYWEPAWITVGDTTGLEDSAYDSQVAANKALWQANGSGWASSYAGEYDSKDAGKWYGGSAVDNEAMFYADGTPTAGLKVWKYVRTGAVKISVNVDSIEQVSGSIYKGEQYSLPATLQVSYDGKKVAESVVWDTTNVDTSKAGTYVIPGTVSFSKDITEGTYKGMSSATVTYTLTVKEVNLITDADDASFESWTNIKVEGTGVDSKQYTKGDAKTGRACVHWYLGSDAQGTVTYNKPITLRAGEYTFEYVAQGSENSTLSAVILDEEGNVLFTGDDTALVGWNNWCTPSVTFTLTEETTIYVQLGISFAAGGWGTADDMYLYKVKDVATTPEETKPEETTPEETIPEEQNPETEKTLPANTVIESETDDNLSVKDTTGILPVDTVLVSSEVTDEAVMEEIKEVVEDKLPDADEFVVYEIDLYNGSTQIHQLNGKVQVTLDAPFTLEANETVEVYRVDGDNLVRCDAQIKDGKLIFTTDHFSTFIFVKAAPKEENQTSDTVGDSQKENNTTAPVKTGETPVAWLYILALTGGMGCMAAVVARRKKNN